MALSYFERVLAAVIGKRRCDGCNEPLGNGPRRHHNRRMYHPGCFKEKSCKR